MKEWREGPLQFIFFSFLFLLLLLLLLLFFFFFFSPPFWLVFRVNLFCVFVNSLAGEGSLLFIGRSIQVVSTTFVCSIEWSRAEDEVDTLDGFFNAPLPFRSIDFQCPMLWDAQRCSTELKFTFQFQFASFHPPPFEFKRSISNAPYLNFSFYHFINFIIIIHM